MQHNEQFLHDIRPLLLHLHESLLLFSRKHYEGKYGKIPSPYQFFNLAVSHAEFAGLRPLSQLIVGLDEMLDSKEGISPQQAKDFAAYAKKLLSAGQTSDDFFTYYKNALQQDPAVALAHAKVSELLGTFL